LYLRELHQDRERNQKNNPPMLVNSYNRLWVANPGPSRLLGGFCECVEAPLESRAAAPRVGKQGRPTTAHCRPSVRTGYAQIIAILKRDLKLSHFCVVHRVRRGLPNPVHPHGHPRGTFDAAHVGRRSSGKRRYRLNRLRDALAFGNTGEYNGVGCLYLLRELHFERVSPQNRPA
jgi:hypothetical protein